MKKLDNTKKPLITTTALTREEALRELDEVWPEQVAKKTEQTPDTPTELP